MKRQLRTRAGNQGFTILEMLIALVVLAVILSLTVPSFRDTASRSALKTTTMDLIASINNSRAQAVSLGSTATLAASDGTSWSNGWGMSLPAPHDDQNQNFEPQNSVTINEAGSTTTFDFRRDGTTNAQLTFHICHDALTGETGREISVNRLGKTVNQEYTCP